MADPNEFNIFKGGGTSFEAALPAIAAAPGLSLPVSSDKYGLLDLHTVRPAPSVDKEMLPAYADNSGCPAPFVRYSALEAAVVLFHAPRHSNFLLYGFTPEGKPLPASKAQLSLLIGRLQSPAPPQGALLPLAAGELAKGALHRAHYLARLALDRREPAVYTLCSTLMELGCYQEAYDGLKTLGTPEAALLITAIHRRTGNLAHTAKALSAVPAGTPAEASRATEAAWLNLEAGREDEAAGEFRRLSGEAAAREEALYGLASALSRKATRTRDQALLPQAIAALESCLTAPGPAVARVSFLLGNLYFMCANYPKAEESYGRTAASSPGLQALANLATAMIRNRKYAEARAVIGRIAMTDLAAARQLAAQLPEEIKPAAAPSESEISARRSELNVENFPAPPQPKAAQPPREAGSAASLEPATPKAPLTSDSFREALTPSVFSPREDALPKKAGESSDFISGAFRLASEIEQRTGKKVRFSREGLEVVEAQLGGLKKLKKEEGEILVRNSAAFLCYLLQERYNGRLLPQGNLDPWAWPMQFDSGSLKTTTYPALRPWKLLSTEEPRQPGWLLGYLDWLTGELKPGPARISGMDAVRTMTQSHQERITDTDTEHNRLLLLAAAYPKTADIPNGRPGMLRIGAIIKSNFTPGIPPSADGWRLLRFLGHILAQNLAAEFKATWFNTDGEDGNWSMRLPWGTFVFPLGKIFKAAAAREDLTAYFDALMEARRRLTSTH